MAAFWGTLGAAAFPNTMYQCLCRLERQPYDRATGRKPSTLLITSPRSGLTLSLLDYHWHVIRTPGLTGSTLLTGLVRILQVVPLDQGEPRLDEDFTVALDPNDLQGIFNAWHRQNAAPLPAYLTNETMPLSQKCLINEEIWRFCVKQNWRQDGQDAIPGSAPRLPLERETAAL